MRINLHIEAKAPTVLLPQNSESTNVLEFKLGDLSLRTKSGSSEKAENIDHMYMRLDSVQMHRCENDLIIYNSHSKF